MTNKISIILPAKNEANSLDQLLPEIKSAYPKAEILVVDDGSTDKTLEVCDTHGVTAISLPYNMGNGAAVKAGARKAKGDILVYLDADGQHNPKDISRLLEKFDQGYDLVVGARSSNTHASIWRRLANGLYNRMASYMTGHKIEDLTSGFRAVRAKKFREFLFLLPNGFSYPTSSTMAFFRAGYGVAYVPIEARKRKGKSHIKPLQDGIRFLLVIFRVGTLYSPLKLYFPLSAGLTVLGVCYSAYTLGIQHRFTNMSALLLIAALLVFLIGLVAEQITTLLYQKSDDA